MFSQKKAEFNENCLKQSSEHDRKKTLLKLRHSSYLLLKMFRFLKKEVNQIFKISLILIFKLYFYCILSTILSFLET